MKFLVDNALSPLIVRRLQEAGYDAVHVRDYGLQTAEDEAVFQRAVKENRILVSADTDFGTFLFLHRKEKTSVVLFRRASPRRPDAQAKLLLANLPNISKDLKQGSIVVIEQTRVRIRPSPTPTERL
jgi:predicted nuclease of predicted toxin-antitoxin system